MSARVILGMCVYNQLALTRACLLPGTLSASQRKADPRYPGAKDQDAASPLLPASNFSS
jgi:hypothetical protein